MRLIYVQYLFNFNFDSVHKIEIELFSDFDMAFPTPTFNY